MSLIMIFFKYFASMVCVLLGFESYVVQHESDAADQIAVFWVTRKVKSFTWIEVTTSCCKRSRVIYSRASAINTLTIFLCSSFSTASFLNRSGGQCDSRGGVIFGDGAVGFSLFCPPSLSGSFMVLLFE